MNTYTIGTKVFCDFAFGGKPRAVVTAIIEPGSGKSRDGQIQVRLTETVGAYHRGEMLTLPAGDVVPVRQEFRKRGSRFRWINTDYQFA